MEDPKSQRPVNPKPTSHHQGLLPAHHALKERCKVMTTMPQQWGRALCCNIAGAAPGRRARRQRPCAEPRRPSPVAYQSTLLLLDSFASFFFFFLFFSRCTFRLNQTATAPQNYPPTECRGNFWFLFLALFSFFPLAVGRLIKRRWSS